MVYVAWVISSLSLFRRLISQITQPAGAGVGRLRAASFVAPPPNRLQEVCGLNKVYTYISLIPYCHALCKDHSKVSAWNSCREGFLFSISGDPGKPFIDCPGNCPVKTFLRWQLLELAITILEIKRYASYTVWAGELGECSRNKKVEM